MVLSGLCPTARSCAPQAGREEPGLHSGLGGKGRLGPRDGAGTLVLTVH